MAFDFPANPASGQTYEMNGVTYVYNNYAWVKGAASAGGGGAQYVLKTGDVMTGFLTLNADPTTGRHAATKDYVDAGGGGGSVLPPGGTKGQALVIDAASAPAWGAAIDGGRF